MASHAHTTSSPNPQTEDPHFDMTHAGADRGTSQQRWVGGLPPDIWLCILDHLCPHCRPGPALKPGVKFTERTNGSMIPGPLPPRSRRDLLSMTMTCRALRDLAQSYVFHCCDRPSGYLFLKFQPTVARRPDLARAVKEIAASSDTYIRPILARLGNLRTLNFGIRPFPTSGLWNARSLPERLVPAGSLEKLGNLMLKPMSSEIVDTAHGRHWLENLMHAAPDLRSLRCYRFTDFEYSFTNDIVFPAKDATPNYAGLPENKITSLNLLQTWFRFHSLEKLLGNFKELREFKISHIHREVKSVIQNENLRPVDGHDVVTLLEPLKHQLEVLELDFCGYPESLKFRSIHSLSAFTTLKSIKLCNMSIGMLPRPDEVSWQNMTEEERETHSAACREERKDILVNLLPCKSLEFLQLDEFDSWFEIAVVEFARRASRGEFPNLKHVRLQGGSCWSLHPAGLELIEQERERVEKDLAQYHGLQSTVPEEYREEAWVELSMDDLEKERKARRLFLAAGVLFERCRVTWPVWTDNDSSFNSGWMNVYPTACAGDCGNPDCTVVKSTS